jgi:hypothetical protein
MQPVETIEYWINAYSDPASGPHFQGHGKIVEMLREYLALRIRSLEATPARVTEAQQFVCGGTPTPQAQRELDDFRKYLELRGRMHTLIANDAYAMTFQTMGQYRTALLRALAEGTPDAI